MIFLLWDKLHCVYRVRGTCNINHLAGAGDMQLLRPHPRIFPAPCKPPHRARRGISKQLTVELRLVRLRNKEGLSNGQNILRRKGCTRAKTYEENVGA
jgi:hypothetical protein